MSIWKAIREGNTDELRRLAEERRQAAKKNSEEAEVENAKTKAALEVKLTEFKEAYVRSIREKEEGPWRQHPEIPYLARLKQQLRKGCENVLSSVNQVEASLDNPINNFVTKWFGGLAELSVDEQFQAAEQKRDEYFHRIENIAGGNYESEVIFLEAEIRKLKIDRQKYQDEKSDPSHEVIYIGGAPSLPDIDKKISEHERDIAEVKTLKIPTKPEPPKPRKRDNLKKREAELFENLAMVKERRHKLILIETNGVPFDECSPEVQRRVKQIENMMANQEQLISDELTQIWASL